MPKVKCNCFNSETRKFISGRTENDDCEFCKDGTCTAESIDIDFDGQYWNVACPTKQKENKK